MSLFNRCQHVRCVPRGASIQSGHSNRGGEGGGYASAPSSLWLDLGDGCDKGVAVSSGVLSEWAWRVRRDDKTLTRCPPRRTSRFCCKHKRALKPITTHALKQAAKAPPTSGWSLALRRRTPPPGPPAPVRACTQSGHRADSTTHRGERVVDVGLFPIPRDAAQVVLVGVGFGPPPSQERCTRQR